MVLKYMPDSITDQNGRAPSKLPPASFRDFQGQRCASSTASTSYARFTLDLSIPRSPSHEIQQVSTWRAVNQEVSTLKGFDLTHSS